MGEVGTIEVQGDNGIRRSMEGKSIGRSSRRKGERNGEGMREENMIWKYLAIDPSSWMEEVLASWGREEGRERGGEGSETTGSANVSKLLRHIEKYGGSRIWNGGVR